MADKREAVVFVCRRGGGRTRKLCEVCCRRAGHLLCDGLLPFRRARHSIRLCGECAVHEGDNTDYCPECAESVRVARQLDALPPKVLLTVGDRHKILQRVRADRIARRGKPAEVDPVSVWREVVASQWHAGIDALPFVPPEYRAAVTEHARRYRDVPQEMDVSEKG